MVNISAIIGSINFITLVFFIIPFSFLILSIPNIINKMKESGFVVKDMYKKDFPEVPANGGLLILLIAMFSLSILSLFYSKCIPPVTYVMVMVAALFAFFGTLDDIINIGRPAKLILLYYCSYSLIPFIPTTIVYVPLLGQFDLGILYLQLIVPLYIPVVANLTNMHSGFNGLAPGLSLIILSAIIIKTMFFGDIFNILFLISLCGALTAYFLYEKYPSKIFWGNIGALTIGASIGMGIVIEGFIISGFIMLIPHTINFLLYVYWRLNTQKYPLVKFGSIREDGTLEVPNPLTLKWILPYYYRMTEKQATHAMYAFTILCCIAAVFVQG